MPLSLHAAFVPSALQMLGATRRLVDKAEGWCGEQGCAHGELIGARLIDDMLAFDYQVKSVAVHTQGAIEGVRAGLFEPDFAPPPASSGSANQERYLVGSSPWLVALKQ